MAYSDKNKEKIKADYESGKFTTRVIAKKWGMSLATLNKFAKKGGWIQGKNKSKINQKVNQKATEQIIEKETMRLVDYTTKHIKQLDVIRRLTNNALGAVARTVNEARNEGRDIAREDSEGWFHMQKLCKISAETLSIAYRDERAAMGLDKEENAPLVQVQVTEADAIFVKNIFDEITV